MHEKYFEWIREVRTLLGKPSGPDDGEDFISMCNDISWFGCYDDGVNYLSLKGEAL
jgi:hypothetical protein